MILQHEGEKLGRGSGWTVLLFALVLALLLLVVYAAKRFIVTPRPRTGSVQIGPNRTIHAPARLMVLTYLFVVESADFVFLMQLTGLTWGNLSTHLSKLEEAGYVTLIKGFRGKKPYTRIQLTLSGRQAFQAYKTQLQQVLNDLPD